MHSFFGLDKVRVLNSDADAPMRHLD